MAGLPRAVSHSMCMSQSSELQFLPLQLARVAVSVALPNSDASILPSPKTALFSPNDLVVTACARIHGRWLGLRVRHGLAAAVIIKHEEADGRRKVAMPPILINGCDHVGQRQIALGCDLLQSGPERVLQTHAGLVSGYHN